MANSQVKIDLIFQANTQAALNNIQSLNNLLNKISTTTTIGIDGGSIDRAVQSAQQLQGALAQATNVDTGKIDLTKLNNSLKQSGTSLKTLSSNLLSVGPQGEQAFVKLANAIGRAETPMFQLNQKLKNFGTTLVNTVKWQMASTLIHGVTGAIQGAISYAEKLNGALNDIQIVTQKSSAEMSKFAETASKSAKALNTTTTEYAKAALIFYQQGLDGSAVQERTEVVLKLAQVTGESAETISDQMTAVWNNFYDGSKSLEYYADVITALGAATAASSDEIVQGLEKFAAVADTIGLSYEYASAALATVVAETRQAPEVVGTAFKTLFGRLQSLSLGETLEDGTDLNKYSEALAAVGVNIKNQSGELKDAQVILQETAKAWDTLGKDQQVALAQSVGGMRQYTQFISLMDNWEKVELNVDVAELSEGTLTEQQETWSESWEAANKRVEQSKNELYSKIINDKTMIALKDIWSDIIDTIGTFIDKMGGIVPVVLMLVGVFSKQLFPIISNGFTRLKNNIQVLTGQAAKQIAAMQNSMRDEIQAAQSSNLYTDATKQQLVVSDKLIQARQHLANSAKNMSNAEREMAERKMAIIEQTANEIQKSLELQAEWEREIALLEKKMTTGTYREEAAKNIISNKYGDIEDNEFQKEYGVNKEEMAQKAVATPRAKTKLKDLGETFEESKEYKELQEKRTQIEQGKGFDYDKTKKGDFQSKKDKALNELSKKEEELNSTYEQRKKQLQEIVSIQEEMASKSPKELSVGKAEAGFIVEDVAENPGQEQQLQYRKNMRDTMKEAVGGTIEKTEGESSSGIVAEASLANLEKAYQLQGQYANAAEKSSQVSTDLKNAFSQTEGAVKKLSGGYKTVGDAINRYNVLNKKKVKGPKEAKEFQQLSAELGKLTKTYKSSESVILKFADTAGITGDELEKLKGSFKKLNDMETAEEGMREIDQALDNLSPSFREAADGAEELALALYNTLQGKTDPQQLENLRQKYENLGREAGKTKGQIDGLNGKINEGLTGPQTFAKRLGGMTQGISQVAGGVMMLQGAFSTLASAFDEGNTPMENFTNYLMGITTLIPAVTSLIQGFSAIKDAMTKKDMANDKKQQASDLTTAGTGALKSSIKTWGFWGIALGAVLALAIIGGAIAAVASAKKPSADEEKEEQLNESITQLTSDLNAAKDAANGFKDAVSNYDDGVKALQKLDEGTNEYAEALEAANEKARELIETYGLTKDDYFLSNTGLIEFADGVLAKKQAELDHAARIIEIALLSAKSELAELQGNKEIKKESPSSFKQTDTGDTVEFSEDDKMNVSKIIVDNNLTKDEDTGAKLTDDEIKDNVLKQIEEIYGKESELYTKVQTTGTDAIAAMVSWSDSLTEMTDAQTEYARKILDLVGEEKYGAIAEQLFGGDAGREALIQGTMNQINANAVGTKADGITNAVNVEFDKMSYSGYDDLRDGELGQIEKIANAGGLSLSSDVGIEAIFGGNTSSLSWSEVKNTEDLARFYYESMGYTGVTVDNSGDGTIKVSWQDDGKGNGPDENTSLTNEGIAQLMAQQVQGAAILHGQTEASIEENEMKQIMTDFLNSNTSNQFGADFSGGIMQAVNNKTKTLDFSNAFMDLDPEEIKQLQAMSPEQLAQVMGLNEDLIKQMGWNTVEEFAQYAQQSFKSYGSTGGKNKIDASGVSKAIGLGFDERTFEKYRNSLAASNKELANNRTLLNQVAIANMRLDRGVKGLADNWEDLSEKMNSGNLADQAEAAAEMEEYVQDILNMSDAEFNLLPEGFIENNWDLIQDVVNRVPGAAQEMRRIANAEKILFNIDTALDPDNTLKSDVEILHDWFVNYDFGSLEAGAKINDSMFYEQINAMSMAAKMTETQLREYLESWDMEAKIVEVKDASGKVIGYKVEAGSATKSKTSYNNYSNSVASASAAAGAQGDSSPAEKVERTKKSDIVERFKETEDVLDDIEDSLKKVNKQMDRLYGPSRLKAMDEEIKLLEDKGKVLEQQYKDNQKYIEEDKQALLKSAKEAGISLQIDEKGNIINYTEELSYLYELLAQAEEKQDKMSTKEEQDSYQENVIDPLKDKIEAFTEASEDWSESIEKNEELITEMQENLYEIQDLEFEKITYKVEFEIEIDDEDLKVVEYFMEKYSDNIYTMAESSAYLEDQINSSLNRVELYTNMFDELNKKYEEGKISEADYAEGLSMVQDGLIEAGENLEEYKKQLEELSENTLSLANEELEKHTEKFEKMTSVIDHYKTIVDLMGKGTNYSFIDKTLNNKQQILNDKLSTSKNMYEQLVKSEKEMIEALNDPTLSDEQRKIYEENLESIRSNMHEWYETMLTDAEAAMENLAEILANNIEKANKELEKALTGGRSFDALSTTAERLQGSQEEYLTTTNKIYETTKMIRNIQNEIDKTTNTVAKQRLKAFQQQTQLLQNQSKLSQFELDIQQKKYDLLLAEIALEEAQNAKSMVRLQRDSEGNFGYVYAANQEDISNAQQGVDDANNALYNARLEGANNYALQYQEIMSQLGNDLAELQEARKNKEISTEEEYEKRKLEIIKYYSDKLTTVSELYSFAISEDAKVAEEAWSSGLEIMDEANETWMESVEEYLETTEGAFEEFEDNIEDISDDYNLTLDDMTLNTDEMATSSGKLADTINNKVIPAIGDELEAMKNLVTYMVNTLIPQISTSLDSLNTILNTMISIRDFNWGSDNNNEPEVDENGFTEDGYYLDTGPREGVTLNSSGGTFTHVSGGSGPLVSPETTKPTETTKSTETTKPTISYSKHGTFKTNDGKKHTIYKGSDNNYYRKEGGTAFGSVLAALGLSDGSEKSFNYNNVSYFDGKTGVLIDNDLYPATNPLSSSDNQIKGAKVINGTIRLQVVRREYSWPTYKWGDDKYWVSTESLLDSFNTGGYTGEWGPEGKLAMLHQKELVLNAQQTEDLFMTMELLDSILKQIDLMSSINKINSLSSSVNNSINGLYKDTLQQDVHIEANFPNVTDRNEIQEAFNTLINEASQYVNRF